MNEKALRTAYSLFKQEGYNGSVEEFVNLLKKNEKAKKVAYDLFSQQGYKNDINAFSGLIGLDKIRTADGNYILDDYIEDEKGRRSYKSMETGKYDLKEVGYNYDRSKGIRIPGTGVGASYGKYLDDFAYNIIKPIFDITGDAVKSAQSGEYTDAMNEILINGSKDMDEEKASEIIKLMQSQRGKGPSKNIKSWAEEMEKESNPVYGFLKATWNNPAAAYEATISSIAGQLSAAQDGELLSLAVAAGGTTAAVGSTAGPIGTVAGFLRGFMSTMGGGVETASKFGELIVQEFVDEENPNGRMPTEEELVELINDPVRFNKFRNKAISKGATIALVDNIGGSIVNNSAFKTARKGKKVLAATKGLIGESIVGGGGEALSSAVIGEEISATDVGLEILGQGGQSVVDVGSALITPGKYQINGEKASLQEVNKVLNTATPAELANIDITVENDPVLENEVNRKKQNGYLQTQVDPAVSDPKDRARAAELQLEKQELEAKIKKGGIFKGVNTETKLENVNKEIDAIFNKYATETQVPLTAPIGPSVDPAGVEARTVVKDEAYKNRLQLLKDEITKGVKQTKFYRKANIKVKEDNAENVTDMFIEQEANNLLYDIALLNENLEQTTDAKTKRKIRKKIKEVEAEYNALENNAQEAKNAHGFLLEDHATGEMTIVINTSKDISSAGNINVAAHELLHAVLRNTFLTETGFRARELKGTGLQTGQKLLDYLVENEETQLLLPGGIIDRLKSYAVKNEKGELEYGDTAGQEVLNLLSDAFVNINYNAKNKNWWQGLGSRISDILQAYLPERFTNKLNFRDGKQVFDFIKTFNKAVAGDVVADRIIERASRRGIDIAEPKQDLATQDSDSVKRETYETINDDGDKVTVQITTAKDGSRTVRYKDDEGITYMTETFAKDNDISNEKIIELNVAQEGAAITKTETIEGFENIANPKAVARRKKELAKKAKKGETTTPMSKEASDRVQSLYDNKPTNFEADIIKEFDPIVSRIVDKRREAPNFDRELLTTEIQYGKRGILDLIRKYDPSKGVPLAAYINDNLPKRAIEASRRILGEEFTQDVTERVDIAAEEVAEPTVTTKPKPKKIVLADRLGITKEVAEAVNKIVPNLDINKLTFKTLKNEIPEITGKLFGISTKKIENLANLTKSELQSAQMFINKNADLLIAMLPEGATAGGTATGVPNSLLKAFYTKTSRAKMAKTGTKAGLAIQQKNNIKKADFLETFGIIDGKPDRTDRNTSARVLALANLTGKMITNQAVRQELGQVDTKVIDAVNRIKDGKSTFMFSKDYVEDVLSKVKLGDINNGNINNRNLYKIFIKENYPKFVPLARSKKGLPMLHAETFGNTSNIIPGKYITKDERKLLTVPANNTQLKNKIPFNKDQTKAINEVMKKTDFFNQKNFNSKLRKQGAEIFVKGLNEAVNGKEGNINNLKPISMLLVGQSNAGTGHVARTMARGLGISNIGTLSKKEHVLVANNAVDIIVESLAKNNIDLVLPWLLDNYYQINVNAEQDALIDNAYKNSKTEMPPVFYENFNKAINAKDMSLASDPLIRYTMANVNLTEINWHTGGNLLQQIDNKYGFDGSLSYGNNSETSIKEVNRILTDFFAKKITKNQAKKAIENISKINFVPKIDSNIRLVKAKNKALAPMFSKEAKGITILDFDDTLATTKSLVKYTAPDGTTGTLNAEQFANTYEDLQDQGYKFDFSDFNKVVKGKLAPLFQKALKLQKKFGPENMFVLTARPPAAQKAIFDFLKANGLNIPLKNITGLGNSTAEAKALWVADKVAEGYNDFYFADDALQNVQAVKNMLDQFDVKSKVQQAKVKFSKDISGDFNKILEDVTGIEAAKRFSDVKARKRGEKKGRFRFFIPPSHEDLTGLLYNFMGKGRKGDAHRDFFENALIRPLNRGYRELNAAKQAIANDYKSLNKQFPDVKKKLTKKTPDGDFTFQDAIRVYLWTKNGHTIPGLSATDQSNLSDIVANDPNLQAYAETLNLISKQDRYVDPKLGWEGGNIRIDLIDATGRVGRAQYFTEFNENAEAMFSEENLNKIEAAYGASFRSALEDMLHRISTGVNRPKGQSTTINKFMNYLNGSVGAVMFFNARSAILQQMSIVNYINFADNNPLAAAKAYANQSQYWKDFAFIFNSDMLKQRRGGIGTDINGAELAEAVSKSKNPTRAAIGYLLKLGFLPTQIGDNIAIATGGATFYRNRINTYLKQGLSKKEAQEKAFSDFQDITESTQQSSRPDKSSQQQSMWIGKLVLNFQNITSQYNRIIKRAASDIYNRRITPPNTTQFQSDASNMSRILYYGAIQNVIFYSLQSALFAVMFGDEDDDNEKYLKKKERVIQGTIDSILRGSGIYGVAVSTLKNMAIKWHEQRDKKYNKDESAVIMEALNFSPVVGIKARKIVNAEKTLNYNKDVIKEMETFDIDNPMWSSATNYIEALTNFPANRLYQKTINLRNALDNDYSAWQRALFFSGYTTWSLGLEDTKKIQVIKETVKTKKREAQKERAKIKREERKKEKEEENKAIIEKNKKKKDGRCAAISSSGKRCSNKALPGKSFCTIHEKTEKISGGRKVQCRKRKADGTRCKMMTNNKSQFCYYHD